MGNDFDVPSHTDYDPGFFRDVCSRHEDFHFVDDLFDNDQGCVRKELEDPGLSTDSRFVDRVGTVENRYPGVSGESLVMVKNFVIKSTSRILTRTVHHL